MFFIDFTCFGFHEAKPPSNAVAPTIRGKIIVSEEIAKDQQKMKEGIYHTLYLQNMNDMSVTLLTSQFNTPPVKLVAS